MIRKGVLVLVLLAVCGVAGVFFAGRLPSSFLPDEDQGYLYVNMQLPECGVARAHSSRRETGGEDSCDIRRESSTPRA